jgi:hypothetical protein
MNGGRQPSSGGALPGQDAVADNASCFQRIGEHRWLGRLTEVVQAANASRLMVLSSVNSR